MGILFSHVKVTNTLGNPVKVTIDTDGNPIQDDVPSGKSKTISVNRTDVHRVKISEWMDKDHGEDYVLDLSKLIPEGAAYVEWIEGEAGIGWRSLTTHAAILLRK